MKNTLAFLFGLAVRAGLLVLAIQGHAWAENMLSFIVVAACVLLVGLGVVGMLYDPAGFGKQLAEKKPAETSRLSMALSYTSNVGFFVAFIALGWFVTAIAQGLVTIWIWFLRTIHCAAHEAVSEG